MVALEIVDDRNAGSNITFEKLVAQNSMNYGCVLGEPVEIDLMCLDSLQGKLIVSWKRIWKRNWKKCFATSPEFCFIFSK